MSLAVQSVVQQHEGESLGLLGVTKVPGATTGGAFAIVEHVIPPGIMLAVPHTHSREDEVSFVIEGEIGGFIGDQEFQASQGAYVLKPRGIPHAVWNSGSEATRICRDRLARRIRVILCGAERPPYQRDARPGNGPGPGARRPVWPHLPSGGSAPAPPATRAYPAVLGLERTRPPAAARGRVPLRSGGGSSSDERTRRNPAAGERSAATARR